MVKYAQSSGVNEIRSLCAGWDGRGCITVIWGQHKRGNITANIMLVDSRKVASTKQPSRVVYH